MRYLSIVFYVRAYQNVKRGARDSYINETMTAEVDARVGNRPYIQGCARLSYTGGTVQRLKLISCRGIVTCRRLAVTVT